MEKQKINIFNWNHISDNLTEDQIDELKGYYASYHRKSWAYKKAMKNLKRTRFVGNSTSVIFGTGGIVAAVATSGISLVAISTASILIQGWMKHKDFDLKIKQCEYAFQTYQHLLNEIRLMMRSGNCDLTTLRINLNNTDDFIVDNTPIVDKYLEKYDKKFTSKTM